LEVDDVVRRLPATAAGTVLIDGRSGSGKSSLADRLAAVWRDSVVVRLDDVYPGWDGLAWAAEHIRVELLAPRAAGRVGRWRRWDWTVGAAAEWHTVEPGGRLIVEGVGALTAATRALADLGIWVDTPDAERKRRALERDGDTYRPHWDRWAAQEDAFIARHRPHTVADLVIGG
jgi:uridine kinase